MNPTNLLRASAIAVLALLVVVPAAPVRADDDIVVVADSTSDAFVIAVGGSDAAASRPRPKAVASVPRGIVVSNHGGRAISLFAEGQPPLRKSRPGSSPATFSGLKAGTAYTVVVGGRSLGKVVALDRPGPVSRLVVHVTEEPDAVWLDWRYRGLPRTGGSSVTFHVSATSPTAATVRARVKDARRAILSGLNPDAIYTFSVTVANTAGRGRATSATMSKTLAQLSEPASPAEPIPPQAQPAPVTPSPQPPVAPPAPPPTRTIYVCPSDYVENSSGTCTRTIAYTYHREPSGPAPMVSSFETTSPVCPEGFSLEDYGWIMYCRAYGPIPMSFVKDAPPSGFTDNGTAWVRTVPKEAVVVPA